MPDRSWIAEKVCALVGFDVRLQSELPAGGTVVTVETLSRDEALVLLSLLPNARAVSESPLGLSTQLARAVGIRSIEGKPSQRHLPSLVEDLVHDRVVIMTPELLDKMRKLGASLPTVSTAIVEISSCESSAQTTKIAELSFGDQRPIDAWSVEDGRRRDELQAADRLAV